MTQETGLNREQQEAVEHLEGPLLVLAGAGSGKTRVVTTRICRLIDGGISPQRILAVTFTNKAAQEMKERVQSMTRQNVLITTFHSLGAKILRESIHLLGYSSGFSIYDEEDSLKLLKQCLTDVASKAKDLVKQAKAIRGMISSSKNELVDPDSVDHFDLVTETERLFPEVYRRYQAQLKLCNAVDFDDLLYLPNQLFRTAPDVLESYQNLYQYLLIDEYQDTNKAQYQMVQLLAGERRNLFVVGDPDQSIYSWRGADMSNILNFEKDYVGAKIIRLEQNYRSRSNILDAANVVIGYNSNRYEKNLWSDRGPGEKIVIYKGYSEHDEAEYIADRIRYHRDEQGIELSEMAIFYRTNFQSRVFEDILLAHRIPYVIVGGTSFYQRREIKDILGFLRVVHSGADYVSFARTVNLPKRGIGDASVRKMRYAAEQAGLPILEFCRQVVEGEIKAEFRMGAKQKAGLQEYIALIDSLRAISERGSLQDLVDQTAKLSGYFAFLLQDPDTHDDRKENVQELIGKALEWDESDDGSTLSDFLEELSLKSSLDVKGVGEECVHLMTVHNGKGLEFPVTFVAGMEEGLFPHASAMDDSGELEEERRLCYVGMTRAKEQLYMTCCSFRNVWGSHRVMRKSRFLGEVPKKYTQFIREDY
jgi:DNA helicase-2/ATP-dependent DNA helicase PcrA